MKSEFLLKAALYAGVAIAFVSFCNRSNATGPAAREVDPAQLVLADNEVPGWIIGDSPNCFGQGVANDSNDLYLLIDGPGVPYIRDGFVNGAFQKYLDTNTFAIHDTVAMCLQVFNQSTYSNAVTIYRNNGNTYTPYIPVTGLGEMARMDTAAINIVLEVVQRNYYINLTVYKRSPLTDSTYERTLRDFASAIITRIETKPAL